MTFALYLTRNQCRAPHQPGEAESAAVGVEEE